MDSLALFLISHETQQSLRSMRFRPQGTLPSHVNSTSTKLGRVPLKYGRCLFPFSKQSQPPSHCDLKPNRSPASGTPYPKVTGLDCQVPSPWSTPRRLALLTQEHQCRISVRTEGILLHRFFRGSGAQKNTPKRHAIPAFARFSPLRYSPGFDS